MGFSKDLECGLCLDILVELAGGLKSDSTGGYNKNNNNSLSISCSDQTYNTPGSSLVKVQLLTLPVDSGTQREFGMSASLLIRHRIPSYPLESCSKGGQSHHCKALPPKNEKVKRKSMLLPVSRGLPMAAVGINSQIFRRGWEGEM